MNTRRALTLIELLVVMAILAIVAALLFASMRAGRDTGDAAQCLGNLRQLASANLRYAAENGGQYCPAQEKSNNVRWHGERAGTKVSAGRSLLPLLKIPPVKCGLVQRMAVPRSMTEKHLPRSIRKEDSVKMKCNVSS